MYPKKCFIMKKSGENVFQVSFLLIQQALFFPLSNSYTSILEEYLLTAFQNLSGQMYAQLIFFLIPTGKHFPLESTHFHLDTFFEDVKPILEVISNIFGREDTTVIDNVILGMFNFMMNPDTIFDIPTFWENMVNPQLTDIYLTGCFRFPSLITYLFLYTHVDRFMNLGLNMMDPHKNK